MAINSDIDKFSEVTFQQSNFWDFTVIENPTLSIAGLTSSLLNLVGSSLSFMQFRIVTCNLPLPGLKTESSVIGKKHYTNREYEGDFQITIQEDILWSAYSYFDDWMKRIYDFDKQEWIYPQPPLRTGILNYWTQTSTNIPTATFMYENMKIRGIENVPQQRETSGPLTLTINLTFEKATHISAAGLVSQLKTMSLTALGI